MFDGVPEELMEIFDPHWGQFPPQVIFFNYYLDIIDNPI